jgi:hypothetical protein
MISISFQCCTEKLFRPCRHTSAVDINITHDRAVHSLAILILILLTAMEDEDDMTPQRLVVDNNDQLVPQATVPDSAPPPEVNLVGEI